MGKTNDGGPAFPRAKWWPSDGDPDADGHPQGGMSLRDYFAAKAMTSLLANVELRQAAELIAKGKTETVRAVLAKKAYEYADAMLEARSSDPLRDLYILNLENAATEMRRALEATLRGGVPSIDWTRIRQVLNQAEAAGVKS